MKPTTPPPCPSLAIVTKLPGRVDSAMLAKYRRADELLVVLKLIGVGNTAPYDFHDKGTRSYIFRFEAQQEGHVLRVPLHLWQAGKGRLAHDLMEQRRLPHAMVVLLEPAPPAKISPPLSDAQMGATDTSTDTRNVVGPGAEPTVAPASGITPLSREATSVATPGADAGTKSAAPAAEGTTTTLSAAAITATPSADATAKSAASSTTDAAAKSAAPATEGTTTTPSAAAITATPSADASAKSAASSTTDAAAKSAAPAAKAPPTSSSAAAATDAPTTAAAPATPAAAAPLQATLPAPTADIPLHVAAYALLENPKRLKALCALLGEPEGALRAAMASPASQIEIASAGWVRRKA